MLAKRETSHALWALKADGNSVWGDLPVASFTHMVQGETKASLLPLSTGLKYKLNQESIYP